MHMSLNKICQDVWCPCFPNKILTFSNPSDADICVDHNL